MVRVVEHGDAGAARVLAGDLHAVLDGFGSRVHEHRLLREVTRRVLGEQFGDPHVALVRRDREQGVGDLPDGIPNRRDDRVVGVTDRRDADARTEVEERVAVDIHQDRAVRALDVDRKGRGDARRDDRVAALLQRERARPGDRGHHLSFGGN